MTRRVVPAWSVLLATAVLVSGCALEDEYLDTSAQEICSPTSSKSLVYLDDSGEVRYEEDPSQCPTETQLSASTAAGSGTNTIFLPIIFGGDPTQPPPNPPFHKLTGCGVEFIDPATVPVEEVSNFDVGLEQQVIDLVNAERQKQTAIDGIARSDLQRTDDFTFPARYHAVDMARDAYFNHDTYDQGLVFQCDVWGRLEAFGLTMPDKYWGLGENIAGGQLTPAAAVSGWMGSTGHRQNILNPNYTVTGVGYYEGEGPYGRYWVQDFGTPKP